MFLACSCVVKPSVMQSSECFLQVRFNSIPYCRLSLAKMAFDELFFSVSLASESDFARFQECLFRVPRCSYTEWVSLSEETKGTQVSLSMIFWSYTPRVYVIYVPRPSYRVSLIETKGTQASLSIIFHCSPHASLGKKELFLDLNVNLFDPIEPH